MRNLEMSGTIQLLSDEVRTITIKDVVYPVVDVFVPGQGAATVFMNCSLSADRISGFSVGVFKNRLSVHPVFSDGVPKR